MKKGSLPLVILLMLASLAGLAGVQAYWVHSNVKLKEEQFGRNVTAAMNQAVLDLETQDKLAWVRQEVRDSAGVEKVIVLNGDTLDAGDLPAGKWDMPKPAGALPEVRSLKSQTIVMKTSGDSAAGGIIMHVSENSTVIHDGKESDVVVQVMPQQQLFEQLMSDIAQDDRPLRERVDSTQLRHALQDALGQMGVKESFRLGVRPGPGQPFALPLTVPDSLPDTSGAYAVRLFPTAVRQEPAQLLVDFPGHGGGIREVLRIVLPTTGVLILVVAGVFGFTVRAWRKQRRLSEMKTEFINNMTHELKTPVATISLAAQALQDPDMMQDSQAVQRYAGVIREENERLRLHIERALENARLERGQLRLNLERVQLLEVVQEELVALQMRLHSRNGKVENFILDQTYVKADAHYLRDILKNLLDNAEKYSPGTPSISLRAVEEKGQVLLHVADKGIGMAAEELGRVFEPYYRVPTGNMHDVKGTGLGLSYARNLARLMGGDITVTSTLGQGSTFTLRLPLAEGGAA